MREADHETRARRHVRKPQLISEPREEDHNIRGFDPPRQLR